MQIQRHIEYLTSTRLVLELPANFVHHQVEILVLTLDEPLPKTRKRCAPKQFADKVKELGDVIHTIPLTDWNLSP
ncbi:MAG: hypothetical protein HC877_18410 [Thioploca sp.]|nr:hypothetical protein [Thioploca sp.]